MSKAAENLQKRVDEENKGGRVLVILGNPGSLVAREIAEKMSATGVDCVVKDRLLHEPGDPILVNGVEFKQGLGGLKYSKEALDEMSEVERIRGGKPLTRKEKRSRERNKGKKRSGGFGTPASRKIGRK
jgi:hypothetical protein